MEKKFLNVVYNQMPTRIKVTDVEDISELQDEIKKKYGDDIPASAARIQLFKSHPDERIATMADYRALPNDFFLEDGPRVVIQILSRTRRARFAVQVYARNITVGTITRVKICDKISFSVFIVRH